LNKERLLCHDNPQCWKFPSLLELSKALSLMRTALQAQDFASVIDHRLMTRWYSLHCRLKIFIPVCFLLGNSPASEFYMPCFRTLCLFHLHRQVGTQVCTPAYEDGTECSETSAYKIQTLGNYPEESIQHSEHDKSLKSRNFIPVGPTCEKWINITQSKRGKE
jgi:hypothetical protein